MLHEKINFPFETTGLQSGKNVSIPYGIAGIQTWGIQTYKILESNLFTYVLNLNAVPKKELHFTKKPLSHRHLVKEWRKLFPTLNPMKVVV